MGICIKQVESKKDLKNFIYLPEKIHKNHKNWTPPIYMDEKAYFNPKKNMAFSYCDTILLLAYKGDRIVGRCMGIINRRFNELKGEKTARFCYLETYEEEDTVRTLLAFVEEWAKGKGMTRIIGPYGFTDQDPNGFIIEGFEHHATIATYYNFEWMPRFIENIGYIKDVDYFVYKIDIPEEIPAFLNKIFERAQRKGKYEILEFKKKKEIKPWIVPVLKLMNECFIDGNIYGYTPLSENEMKALAKKYLPVLNPHFVKGILVDGEIVAFFIGMPDMTEGIRKARGRLFPFGFLKILRASKHSRQLDLLLGGIREAYQGRGLDVLMGVKMILAAREAGIEFMDTHHELESNIKVRGGMLKAGGELYKKFRVYQKQL
jgi:hypothetical protein